MKTLLCFALKEEGRYFTPRSNVEVLILGMGRENARKSCQVIPKRKPDRVITAGFAGALNPALRVGQIVVEGDEAATFAAGTVLGKFYCSPEIAVTASDKAKLFRETGADCVEMESGAVREFCQEHGIPCTVVRIVSDGANENLPMDFNKLTTADMRMNFPKLLWELVKKPSLIPKLLRLQKQMDGCARELDRFLAERLSS
jgi:adenosylhomocysteine nucleosidase